MEKRLQRSRRDRVIGGVCGGLAAYLEVDAVLVRVVFALLALASGGTFGLIYLILWFVMPEEGRPALTKATTPEQPDLTESQSPTAASPEEAPVGQATGPAGEALPPPEPPEPAPTTEPRRRDNRLLGWLLVGVGAYFLLRSLGLEEAMRSFWPLLLIAIGLFLLWPYLQRR